MGSIVGTCRRGLKRYEMMAQLPWGSALKALRAALRGKVVKHVFRPSGRYLYVVEGPQGRHLVMGEKGCSCLDYYLNVVIRRRRDVCYHIAAVAISEEERTYRVREHRDPEFIGVVKRALSSEGLDPDP